MYEIKTIGYANYFGQTPEQTARAVTEECRNSILIDCRWKPYGKVSIDDFKKVNPLYHWIAEFGNPEMKDVDEFWIPKPKFMEGMRKLMAYVAEHELTTITLMCAEKYTDTCHRLCVADMILKFLIEKGSHVQIKHLGQMSKGIQQSSMSQKRLEMF